jgi:hypothetical protein
MPLSEYLAAMGENVQPGDRLLDVLTSRRLNAIMDAVRALAAGGNLVQGPGIIAKRNPTGVVLKVAPGPRVGGGGPRTVSVEIALDANTPPTSAQINAALLAYYTDGTVPREGDTFRISRADNHYPEVEVRLTATELGPDWRFSPNSTVTIQEKPWYRIVRDISGRGYFEGSDSKTTTDEEGITVLNKTGSKTLSVDPEAVTADMEIRDIPVVIGSEVKIARILASEPVSQDPPVTLPGGQEYLEGGGIRFLDSETDAKYITVYLPEIADPADQDAASLMNLEYVPATLPGGGEGFRLRYSLRIVDNESSRVRMQTDDGGDTQYFTLNEATLDLLESLEDIVERVEALETAVEAQTEEILGLQTAISGATIDCDETGVTLTWGTP